MNMPSEYPVVTTDKNKVVIDFVSPGCMSANSVEIPLVLDLDLYGQVIGIEVLNFCSYGGVNTLADFDRSKLTSAGMRLSYDEEVDAFSLKIDDGRSLKQRAVTGKLFLDANGRMTSIEAHLG